jgi:molybdopterin guanine dinucleotide-containing S/N-oxide reductase-like protein
LSKLQIPISCNLDCGGGCPLLAIVDDGKINIIKDNPIGSKYMTGCVKGFQMHRVLYAEDRLRKPLIRTDVRGSGKYREVNWSEALDLIAQKLTEIKQKYGASSIMHLGGSGSSRGSLHNTNRLAKRFLAMLGGYTERHSSYSIGAATYVTPYILGTLEAGIDSATLQHSKLIILWGTNVSDLKLECGLESRLNELKKSGVKIVVIDPRRTATVKTLATQWIPIYPGTDTVLMMAILYVLIKEGLVQKEFTELYSYGYNQLAEYILGYVDGEPKTPVWAEEICGVKSTKINELALIYGATHPTALIPGNSIQRTIGGEEAIRMAITLQIATGNLGIKGGSSGALAFGSLPKPKVGQIGFPKNPAGASIPVYRWAEAIIEGKSGGFPSDIKAIYNVGGNYLTQGSDTKKAIKAFLKPEFSICHERFLTPTARYCDIILPTTTFLERSDVIIPNSGNYLLFSNQVSLPIGESRNDYDVFCELAHRLGFLEQYSEGKDEEAWLRSFVADSEVKDFDEFKRTGIFFGEDQLRVGLSDFIKDPKRCRLNTPSGRVQLFSEDYARMGASAIPEPRLMKTTLSYPLRLISPKSRFRVHSQNANIKWFTEREEHSLWINPYDAESRDILNGDEILVTSPNGSLTVRAKITHDIMRGVVCLLEGIWPNIDAKGIDRAGAVNILTSTVPTLPSQSSRTHSVIVQVAKIM